MFENREDKLFELLEYQSRMLEYTYNAIRSLGGDPDLRVKPEQLTKLFDIADRISQRIDKLSEDLST